MKNKVILVFLGFAAMFALPAIAQKNPSGFYLGAGVSGTYSSSFCDSAGSDCRDHDNALKGFGGYQFNRYLAVEAGFQNLGNTQDKTTTATAEGRAGELVGIISYPFLKEFSAFLKGGVYKGRLTGFNPTTGASFNESDTDVTMGAGIQWYFYDAFSLRGEYQRYPRMGGGGAGASTDFDVWSLSVIFRFE